MRIALRTTPAKLETLMIKMIVNDLLVGFVFLTLLLTGVTIGVGIVYLRLIDIRVLLMIVPVVTLFCALVSVIRFLGYLGVVWRVMGSFKRAFREFDLEEGNFTVDFKPPFLVFRGLLHKYAVDSDEEPLGYVFSFEAASEKYTVEEKCEVVKGAFRLSIFVEDWHNFCHQRRVEGTVSEIHPFSVRIIREIRQEVLESRGVKVEQLRVKAKDSRSEPVKQEVKPEPIAPQQVREVPEPVPNFPPSRSEPTTKNLEESLSMLDKLKNAEEVPHSSEVAAHEETIKNNAKSAPSKDKKSLQDALYQLQEINKILDED